MQYCIVTITDICVLPDFFKHIPRQKYIEKCQNIFAHVWTWRHSGKNQDTCKNILAVLNKQYLHLVILQTQKPNKFQINLSVENSYTYNTYFCFLQRNNKRNTVKSSQREQIFAKVSLIFFVVYFGVHSTRYTYLMSNMYLFQFSARSVK